ncbi:hypothetical protein A3C09_00530 [Candidatus Uhrbacteria bacterium RIFCSPHIGHO2_02_FULL_47_44]|uniref:Uncharacterized protein n=1 Tax=Candidatus Uhrbacteria bacterium RIFCSPLOWO2_02_FULL_48_18 TaxID=1802408 RepID=A0A1F7V8F8_9BACT|nr:MAG: hypothetical protein A2839_04035 [Candidatus Uhrbacteria bacterium RIFCSPHIGHO2_01_FULL_47_10]OGL70823.1 MAG: hypothetical protein A3C09_00530 [Candidatus Uhrbacteria bacterium RIFCSPHIGHO2_02_FULL_47_44]OGL75896.1 MAG: hypothetical protein A3E97_03615 [Candidatus Uhrbacteria bacterium RIFCSPHIGHO2_12_FULL_47_12]OGL82582.1 MAG: hypothetical protein A3B20_00050 [Candidatus Uhrbacteria bacterium RIFCSPLOWO2_01_FULL_47_17]OGL86793.1 MAG: hypothetical protein A3I41_04420 [Candidatus Uhrbact
MPHFETHHQEILARTGFFVSLASYGLFWLLDLIHPGFVARFFSVHLFLLGMIVFGIWWGSVVEEYTDRPKIQEATLVLVGILCAVLTWNLGEMFGGWRLIVSAVAFVVPLLVLRLLKYK